MKYNALLTRKPINTRQSIWYPNAMLFDLNCFRFHIWLSINPVSNGPTIQMFLCV